MVFVGYLGKGWLSFFVVEFLRKLSVNWMIAIDGVLDPRDEFLGVDWDA